MALKFRNSIPKCNTKNDSKLTVSSISKSFYFLCMCVSVCIGVLCVRVHSWRIPEMAYFVPRENTFGFSGVCVMCLCFCDRDRNHFSLIL